MENSFTFFEDLEYKISSQTKNTASNVLSVSLEYALVTCLEASGFFLKYVSITVTEFLLVEALARHPGHVKNRDQLIDAAYGEHIYVDDRTIDSHIKRLRRKFKIADENFQEIETLYGIGYRYRSL